MGLLLDQSRDDALNQLQITLPEILSMLSVVTQLIKMIEAQIQIKSGDPDGFEAGNYMLGEGEGE